MDKVFFTDFNSISYKELINYINGECEKSYTENEIFLLNTLKKIVDCKVHNLDNLIKSIQNSNHYIEIYTSGTTDNPKLIKQPIKNLIRNVKVSNERVNDIWGLFYQPEKMAWYQVLFQSILNKNTLINMHGYTFNDMKNRIDMYDVTHISATPTLYSMIVGDVLFNKVKQITFGGESSTHKFQNNIKKYFPNAKVKNIYASTEAGSLFASDGELFSISKKDINLIKVENGELLIHKTIIGKSDNIEFENDWYKTGDLVEFINNNQFKIVGRSNHIVNVGGNMINLNKIESKILNMSFVKLCKVYSKKNSVLGNVVICDLVLNKNISEKEIKNEFKNNLEKYEVPFKINLIDFIEINKNGKIKR